MPDRRKKPSPETGPAGGNPGRARYWPLPDVERILPPVQGAGSFWEERGDRRHTGVDLYAPPGSRVTAIEDGKVISAGVFTSPELVPYWNRTYEVTISHASGIFGRYAELGDITVGEGDSLRGGGLVGHVGEVLNLPLIGPLAPPYIRSLKERGHGSMLHLEIYSSVPGPSPGYRGGNWFSRERPAHLLDPIPVLRDTL
jgi:hypothetical protein